MRAIIPIILGLAFSLGLAAQPDDAPKLPEGTGKEVTERVCAGCHGVETVTAERHSKDEWQNVVDDMVSRGADASEAELKTIVEYLAKYLGPKSSPAK